MDKRFKNKPVFKEKFLKLDFKVKLSEARAQLLKFEHYMMQFHRLQSAAHKDMLTNVL